MVKIHIASLTRSATSSSGVKYYYRVPCFSLYAKTAAGHFVELVGAIIDTGAGFTTIPTALADRHGIKYDKTETMGVRGTSGSSGSACIGQATIAFEESPAIEFDVTCLFNPNAPYPLLAWSDIESNFLIESNDNPNFGLLLNLKKEHNGRQSE